MHTYVYKYTFLMLLASIVHRRLARVIAIDGPTPKVQLSIGLGLSSHGSWIVSLGSLVSTSPIYIYTYSYMCVYIYS